jgi:signal transduction histidine kinase/ligand-binding sensor domain-containing protein/DNA-binding response OmpR family regulator
MKSLPILSIIAIVHVLTCSIAAEEMRFEHISTDHGLSQNMIYDITQDKSGFLWIATKDGLNRYDGYTFRLYRYDPFDSTSIADGEITSLFIDSKGRLWAGSRGLSLYSSTEDLFRRYISDVTHRDFVIREHISTIHETPAGPENEFFLWLGTEDEGLYRLRFSEPVGTEDSIPHLIDLLHFKHDPADPFSLSGNDIYDIKSDRKNNLWIATGSGLHLYLPSCETPDAPCFRRYDRITNDRSGLMNTYIKSLQTDADGNITIGSRGGISRILYNDDTVEFDHYPFPADLTPDYPWPRTISSMQYYDEKTVWLGMTSALGILDLPTRSYRFIRHNPRDPFSLSFNSIQKIFRDEGGLIWLGTSGKGLSKYNPKLREFNAYLGEIDQEPYRSAISVYIIFTAPGIDGNEKLWFSSENSLYTLDRGTGEVNKFAPGILRPFDFYGIIRDKSGILWIATNVGIYLYDPADGSVDHLPVLPEPSDVQVEDRVYSLLEDRDGKIWAATLRHISRYDPDSGSFNHYRLTWEEGIEAQIAEIRSIYQDARPGTKSLWLGSDNGFARFDTESGTMHVYRSRPAHPEGLNYSDINCIVGDPENPQRFIWIGTRGGGLYRYDIEDDIFKHYTTDHGLPNNVIYGILPDDSGNLWLSTNRGISKFNAGAVSFKNYDINDGLQGNEFNTRAYHKSESGEMFFGGINGFNAFFPDNIQDNLHIPPVVLTGFQINYETVPLSIDGTSPLKKSITETGEIRLRYTQNIVSFEITALDFTIPSKNRYAYMLENFDSDWIYPGTERRVNYSNLPPGKYRFRAKASNNDGIWNEDGLTVSIVILPPPWRTWWAYSLYFLTGIFLLYILRRYELNRMRLKSGLQIERIEAEKLREIDRAKSHFFANVSHEFRTPLTLILGSLERLQNRRRTDGTDAHHELIGRSARRLLELINQILDIARLEAGQLKLELIYSDLIGFVRRLTVSFQSYAEQRGIELLFISDNVPVDSNFDPDKIEKVFTNLISNALKFTPPGGYIHISATLHGISNGKTAYVEFTVENSGPGIPKDQLTKIFDRFYRVPGTVRKGDTTEGAGIGLSLAKELIELHGGTITVDSVENEKTIFTVRLPIEFGEGVTEHRESPTSITDNEETTTEAVHSGPEAVVRDTRLDDAPIVLIVEDSNDVRRLIYETLEEDFKIVEAVDGIEGRDIALDIIPDLIVSDVMMPGIDGFELCEILKTDERTSHIPIVMLTAKAGIESKIIGLEYGADDYILKPFSGKEIRARIKNLIEQRRKLRDLYGKTAPDTGNPDAPISVDDKFLRRVLDVVKAHISDENFDVLMFSREVGLSHSQLHRKLTALTGKSASHFVRSVRLSKAAELLRQNAGNVAEITYQVGFSSQAYFSKCFHQEFGCSPTEYKKRK